MPYLRPLVPITGQVIKASKSTAVRYERDHPGDLVLVDAKKIGRIPDGGGWRTQGRQMGSTSARRKARIGFYYVHAMVDDHSRLAYSEILPEEQGLTCAGFVLRVADYIASHGISRIHAAMTDNNWATPSPPTRPTPSGPRGPCT